MPQHLLPSCDDQKMGPIIAWRQMSPGCQITPDWEPLIWSQCLWEMSSLNFRKYSIKRNLEAKNKLTAQVTVWEEWKRVQIPALSQETLKTWAFWMFSSITHCESMDQKRKFTHIETKLEISPNSSDSKDTWLRATYFISLVCRPCSLPNQGAGLLQG